MVSLFTWVGEQSIPGVLCDKSIYLANWGQWGFEFSPWSHPSCLGMIPTTLLFGIPDATTKYVIYSTHNQVCLSTATKREQVTQPSVQL